ncbi:MAG: S41 family peptidase [Sandaracinaceae bacterium]
MTSREVSFIRGLWSLLAVAALLVAAGCSEPTCGAETCTEQQWADRVDATWGEAPSLEERLAIFDYASVIIGSVHPDLQDPSPDWNEAHDALRAQDEAAESYGAFAAVLFELADAVRHTAFAETTVCGTPNPERPPVVYGYTTPALLDSSPIDWLGACVTPLADDRLLVYRVADDNPAGLEPGDVLLGYDGLPWRENAEALEALPLPRCSWPYGHADAEDFARMASAPLNVHLFETVEVQRFGASAPESLRTEDLLGFASPLLCTGQLPVEGVEFPYVVPVADSQAGTAQDVSAARLPGDIGYVYVYNMYAGVGPALTAAVESLMDTRGLVLDLRTVVYGSPDNMSGAMAQLFDEDIDVITRCWERDPVGTNLRPCQWPGLRIDADEATLYDRPIAVLVGPESWGVADHAAYMLRLHPRARVFGLPTPGAFRNDRGYNPPPPASDFGIQMWVVSGIERTADGRDLLDVPVAPDEEVWLTPEDVAAGRDTVVEAALAWIASENDG